MCKECRLTIQGPFTVPKELPLGHPAQEYAYPWKDRLGEEAYTGPGSSSGLSRQSKGLERGRGHRHILLTPQTGPHLGGAWPEESQDRGLSCVGPRATSNMEVP